MKRRSDASDHVSETSDLRGFDDFDLCLGDVMRGERATLGKSLLDVQRELKIKATYISAIENTDPTAFDTPGFVAGYVRSYARYLGLDPEWAFKTFCDEGNFTVAHGMSESSSIRTPSQTATTGSKKPAHMRDMFTEPSVSYLPKGEAALSKIEPRAVGSILVLFALLGGIGYGGWAVLQEVQKVRLTPVDQTPEVMVELDPLTSATAPNSEIAGLDPPSIDRFDRLYRPEALDVPVLTARDGPISAIDPNSVGTLAPRQDERFVASGSALPNDPFATVPNVAETAALNIDALLPPPVQVVEEPAPSVTLLAVRPSWVRVQAADGTVIFEKILDAGEQFDVPLTEEPPVLRAGNAGSLYFAVSGETYGPAGGGPAVIKDVSLSPDALTERYEIANAEADNDLARFVAVAQAGTENN